MSKLSHTLARYAFIFACLTRFALGAPRLPDLTVASRDVQVLGSGSSQAVYFSTVSINQGVGPLELRVVATYPDGHEDVNQRIYNSDGTYTEQFAGTFVYHAAHGHIHFEDFANYYLREVTADGGVGEIVAGSEKVSFCMLDTQRMSSPPAGSPTSPVYGGSGPGTYPGCSNSVQGLSVGWTDVYSYTLAGQSISLNGVSGGTYWLELVSDPANRLAESNESNNFSRVQLSSFTTSFSPEINVTGNGQSIVTGDVTPSPTDNTDFGSVDVGSDSLTHTFMIQNSGTGTLSFTGVPRVQVSGTGNNDFVVTTQPLSPVSAGGSTNFRITFAPIAAGPRNATVTIINNDSSEGNYTFTITGNGVPDSDSDGEDDISEAASATDPNNPNSVVRTGKQLNISTRLNVLTGDNIGIGGFIISGADPKTVVVRALGPSLTALGVVGALSDPTLELHDQTGAVIGFDNNWKDSSSQQTLIQNAGLAPSNDLEAALVQTLAPGGYTALVQGNGGATGVGLVEVYDVDPNSNSSLANISTRGFASTGESVMIGGEIIGRGLGANGAGSAKVVVRALGPSLPANIANRLQDPVLELRDGNGALVASNDDWQSTQQSEIQATGLAPTDIHESAILRVLTQGNYTAILSGKGGSVGVALIEAYKVQ